MIRTLKHTFSCHFSKKSLRDIKSKVLYWLKAYSTFAYYDNNEFANEPQRFELLVAADAATVLDFDALSDHHTKWRFGYLSYDYKNIIERRLHSNLPDYQNVDNDIFFIPNIVLYILPNSDELFIESDVVLPQEILKNILDTKILSNTPLKNNLVWQDILPAADYLDCVKKIQNHIIEGDCYELNLCGGKYTKTANLDVFKAFDNLNKNNPAPFAAFVKINDIVVLCASPERYLYKSGQNVISQPIKGTIKRDLKDDVQDVALKIQLRNDPKEQAENVMIVDLVRNDLAKFATLGSVHVDELFGVYSFQYVHHLISTISATIPENTTIKELIHATFPMGSMTGAPKYIVMELIEQYEKARRGVFSGSLGYCMPNDDFDFNVVIRSMIYNFSSQILSYYTGGAITIDSIPEKEMEEMELKSSGLINSISKV